MSFAPWLSDVRRAGRRLTVHAMFRGQDPEGIFAFFAILGGSVGDYARDLRASVTRIFRGGGLEAALRAERARNKATVLALAVLADGEVTEAERHVLVAFAARERVDPDEIFAKVTPLAERLRDARFLRDAVARVASELDPGERLELFVAVENLARRGSRAWPDAAGYRGAGPEPEALVTIFRDALGITTTAP